MQARLRRKNTQTRPLRKRRNDLRVQADVSRYPRVKYSLEEKEDGDNSEYGERVKGNDGRRDDGL